MVRKILYILGIICLIGIAVAFYGYNTIFTPNTAFDAEEAVVLVPNNAGFSNLLDTLDAKGYLKDVNSFEKVAGWMNFKKDRIPSGRFVLPKNANNREIVQILRSGVQAPINLTFNNVRTIDELAGAIAPYISYDSLEILNYLNTQDTYEKLGYSKENFLSLFIPNTYKVYWNTTPEQFLQRMKKENKAFWEKKNRLEKAEALGMTPEEVYTLASIVEKESQYGPERPTIAGLYLNRLKKGIHLQADPTVVFATGKYDLRRVLNKHLAYDSPYNTYLYAGLPPGPIYMPSIESIDAVLNYEKHDYLFMCAKPGFGTKHAFAKTLRGHNKNANEYRKWLSSQGIR